MGLIMLIPLFIFIFIPDIADSQCGVGDNLANGGVNYSLFNNCSFPYSEAVTDCESRDMQVLQLKTKEEMHFFSENIISLGYDNSLFWIAYICPAIAVIPDDPNFCFMMTANVTANTTSNSSLPTAYVKLTYSCDVNIGWICEERTSIHPCPTATSSPTTVTSTTVNTPTTTDPITTITTTTTTDSATASSITTDSVTTTSSATQSVTTTSSATQSVTTTSSATQSVTTTSRATQSVTTIATTTALPATPSTVNCHKELEIWFNTDSEGCGKRGVHCLPSICTAARERRLGSNLYHVFDQCLQTLVNASSLCVSYNSTLAVLVSQQEMTYLADLTAEKRNGSWSYWIGGLTEARDCVMFTLDWGTDVNRTNTKYRITMGYQCTESYPFICKTFVDTMDIRLKLRRPDSPQGSVMDYRPTAIFLGSVGIGVLVMVLVVVVVIDMPNLVSDVRKAKRRVCRFKSKDTKLKTNVIEWKKGPTNQR